MFKPIGDKILVKFVSRNLTIQNNVVTPHEELLMGKVIDIGNELHDDDIKIGDIILFESYDERTLFTTKSGQFGLVNFYDVLGIDK